MKGLYLYCYVERMYRAIKAIGVLTFICGFPGERSVQRAERGV